MIWVTEPDGRCSYLSETWYAFTGQSPQEALGFGWVDAIHPEDRPGAERALLDAHASRASFRVDYRLRRHDGVYRWTMDAAAPRFGPDGAFVGYIGSVVDITDRKQAEDALRESETRFRALFRSIDEGFCLCEIVLDDDGAPVDYRFLEANPLFASMTGLVDAVGRRAYEMIPGLEPSWLETYARVALEGEPLRFEQGSEAMGRWFDVFATPVEPHGRFALVFKDVTERRRAEAALREREAAERRARHQAELLEEIGRDLEAVEGLEGRLRRLAELLVPRVADYVLAVLPGRPPIAHGDPDAVEALVELQELQGERSLPARAASGVEEVRVDITPASIAERVRDEPELAGPLRRLAPRSVIALPVDLGVGLRAGLLLGLRETAPYGYSDYDLAFVRRIAERAGVVAAREHVREEEHNIALRLQQALLPDRVVGGPEVEVAARYVAASGVLEVGGDWYDTLALDGDRLGLVVGDVVGHGLDAAAAMGRLRIALAALAPHSAGPGELLSHLDRFAVGPNRADFATACCATLDTSTGELRYASAGHPPMLLVDPRGEVQRLEAARSAPLYGLTHDDRPEASVVLEPGALLVLYSDGLVERREETLDLGFERLERAVVAARDLPVDELCERLVDDLGVGEERSDDVVVVVLRLATIVHARLRRTIVARASELRGLRAAVRDWLGGRGLHGDACSDLLLVLGEACANAVEHAYPAGAWGEIEVEVCQGDEDLLVQVRDFGAWRPGPSDEDRGRGTTIMQAVASEFTRRSGPEGTTLRLRVPLDR